MDSRSQMRAGRADGLQLASFGALVSDHGSITWRHPWFVQPAWMASAGQWVATIKPGFVNGKCPVFRTTQKEQGPADFGINPLSGKPFFSDFVFSNPAPKEKEIDIPLYLSPAIPLTFRAVGFDGSPQFPVPKFFAGRGVADAPKGPVVDEASGEVKESNEPAPGAGLRLLRACDLWIHQPRLALTSEVSIQPGPVTGISNVTQTLGLASAVAGDKLRVMAGLFREPPGIDPLAGVFEEPAWDELPIATVFLLSPFNTEPGTEPDASWTPFVKHNLFWNLNYVTPWFRQYGGNPDVPFLPPLAGGAAQIVTNYLLASINDITAAALNLVVAHSMAGTFYTPTGGGHSSKMPPSAAKFQGVNGADREGRIAAQKAAERLAAAELRLDPSYPYEAQPFFPSILTQKT